MIGYRELRTISLNFRRISSNLLSSDEESADVNLYRMMNFIEKTPFIHDLVYDAIGQVEYDFRTCFPINPSEWTSRNIPADEECHIKAIYDYVRYIIDKQSTNVLGLV